MRTLQLRGAEVRIYPDLNSCNRGAAVEFMRAGLSAIADHNRFTVALAGGSTPRAIYEQLAGEHQQQPKETRSFWEKVEVFFGDERFVPPNHPDSNFRMAVETLLARVPIANANVHPIPTDLDPPAAAKAYEAEIRAAFALPGNTWPRFDLVMLGLGADGHTASLFPGSQGLKEAHSIACANWAPAMAGWRITLTFPVLNAAATVLFAVVGESKAAMVRNILLGDPAGVTYPAQQIQPARGRLLWVLDEGAASALGS